MSRSGPRPDVALDARLTAQMSVGMQSYARELAFRLPQVAPDLHFAIFEEGGNFGWHEQVRLPLALRRARPRMTHFLSLYAPLWRSRPYAITIHDLIHLRFPQFHKRKIRPYYAFVVRAACAGAARVITDDERTVADLERFLAVPPAKVRVVPLGVDDAFLGAIEPEWTARPFFLYVGNHREHKDLPTLFAAWEALPERYAVDLLLTGGDDLPPGARRPTRRAGEMRFLGEVSLVRLARLYRSTTALVHPALCEGFGLPLLEAAAVGARMIASADAVPAPLRPFVDVFPARDVTALKAFMEAALERPGRPEEARKLAHSLTWDRCAAATAEVYREVLEESSAR